MNKDERESLRGKWVPIPTVARLLDYCDALEAQLASADPGSDDAPSRIVAWIYKTYPNLKAARKVAEGIEAGDWKR